MNLILIVAVAGGSVLAACGTPGELDPGVTSLPWVWRDAADTLIGPNLLVVDADGFQWSVDIETGALGVSQDDAVFSYLSDDCTGTPYIAGPPTPLRVFKLRGESEYRVRRSDGASEAGVVLSSEPSPSGDCYASSAARHLIIADTTVPIDPIEPPVLNLVPPLRFERQ